MRSTILKSTAALESELKFASRTLAEVKSKFIEATREGQNKPTAYAADEEYTHLFKLGPVVADAIEAIKKLEDNMAHINAYIGEQLGNDPLTAELPEVLTESITLNNKVKIQASTEGDITFTSL